MFYLDNWEANRFCSHSLCTLFLNKFPGRWTVGDIHGKRTKCNQNRSYWWLVTRKKMRGHKWQKITASSSHGSHFFFCCNWFHTPGTCLILVTEKNNNLGMCSCSSCFKNHTTCKVNKWLCLTFTYATKIIKEKIYNTNSPLKKQSGHNHHRF